jgi:sugar lactone lactonase YvrE
MLAILALLLLAGCAPKVAEKRQRYFWPPPPAEPRIEYLDYFMVEQDLDKNQQSSLVDAFLGSNQPEPLFTSPTDVASDGRRIMVSDPGRHQVLVLDRVDKKLRFLKSATGEVFQFSAPYGVTVDRQGIAYVTDTVSAKVFVFSPAETLVKVIGDEQLSRPTGVAVDPARGRLYVTDTAEHHVAVFDLEGKLLSVWGERGPGQGNFNFPTDVDLDADGNLYVLDALNAKVQVLDPSGVFLREFGERGTASGSFQVPKGIAISPTGLVVVTDTMAKRFVIFDTKGEYLLSIGGRQRFTDGTVSPGGFYMPTGVDIDSESSIWIVDLLNRIVHQYQYLTADYLARKPIEPKDAYVPAVQGQ